MFDHSKLSKKDKIILTDFFVRRSFFNNYIKENHLELQTCPGCSYPTLSERGGYEICSICNWEDDNQDDEQADEIWGGPNGKLSLTENRINIGKILDEGKGKNFHLDNVYAESVLKYIEDFEKKQSAIEMKMTGNETLQNPIWKEWKQVEKDLQNAINQINKS